MNYKLLDYPTKIGPKEKYVFKEINAPFKKILNYKQEKDNITIYESGSIPVKTYDSIYQQLTSCLRQVLLPSGWPYSVSDDYMDYQIWDSAQAFCSGITSILSTRAILIGVGVGRSESKPLSATITWILKDGTGMCGKIVFAWLKGKNLDTDCKKWRLFADILNDMALALELVIPVFMNYSTELLCLSTSMKAIVGVAGGATRASITQHQAIRDNTGDVSAKDGSQETFVNLCASIFGVILLTYFDEGSLDWTLFILFCVLHLFCNYKAVKALHMRTLNEERYAILLAHYLSTNQILETEKTNEKESVFLGFGLTAQDLCNFHVRFGCSMNDVCLKISPKALENISILFENCNYILILHGKSQTICILLKTGETADTVLSAYFSAIYYGLALSTYNKIPWTKLCDCDTVENPLFRLRHLGISTRNTDHSKICDLSMEDKKQVLKLAKEQFYRFREGAIVEGWNLNTHQLQLEEWRYQK